jgi:hypothetical protein
MRRLLAVVGLTLALPGLLLAQASQFGTRALGLPALPISARSDGTAGAFGLFDPESALGPASIGGLRRTTAGFNARQFWRSTSNPYGSDSGNDTQFPLFIIAGPAGPKWHLGISVAAYTDRTFALAHGDTIPIRGVPVAVRDTLFSRGGINDIRFAAAYAINSRIVLAGAVHVLTGTNRMEYRRTFGDSSYAPIDEKTELSFAGPGASAGLLADVAKGLRIAGLFRWDGNLKVDKDSTRLYSVTMPYTYGGGVQYQRKTVVLAAQVLMRNWSVADSLIKARGGLGSVNTLEYSAGLEYATHAQPTYLPIRLGFRHAQLPFPLVTGSTGQESAISAGTGFRFTGGRGSLDFALHYTWRNQPGGYTEHAVGLSLGVGIRP